MDKPVRIKLKPLSVNDSYKGRRFSTPAKKVFEKSAQWLLPKNIDLPEPPYEIYFKFGFSSKSSDWDNPIKNCQDLLAERYGFNDKLIRRGVVDTEIVPKGQEFFEFRITKYVKSEK